MHLSFVLVLYGSICDSASSNSDFEQRSSERSAVTTDEPTGAPFAPTYRSGTLPVSAGIPVETLRVWERRYRSSGRDSVRAGIGSIAPKT